MIGLGIAGGGGATVDGRSDMPNEQVRADRRVNGKGSHHVSHVAQDPCDMCKLCG